MRKEAKKDRPKKMDVHNLASWESKEKTSLRIKDHRD
jgi:hypothetical protein